MLFPILMGVALKVVSLIPIILAKLAVIGSMAIMASKLSLILTGIIGLKKLFSGADGGLSQQSHHYHDGHYAYYVGDGQQAHHKMTYVVRGRGMKDQEDWTPLVMDEGGRLITGDNKEGLGKQEAVQGRSQRYFAQSIGDEVRDNVRGMSGNMYTKANENKTSDDSYHRQSKSLKSPEAAHTRGASSEPHDKNLAQGASNSNSMSHGDTGPVTHHEALYTHDRAETRIESHVTDDRYNKQSKQNVSGVQDEYEVQYNEEKGPQNKVTRLVRRHFTSEMEGQNHNSNYRTGRRRLDEVEGENIDSSIIRRTINHA
jgi:hypothetical protein